MAENKKSFILYCDQKGLWEKLSDEQAGRLIKHVIAYVNDENPAAPDFVTELAFEPIKAALKRDLSKWDDIKEKRRIAGLASAEARRQAAEHDSTNSTSVESVEQDATLSTVSVNDSVNVSVSVNESEKSLTKVSPEKSGNAAPSLSERIAKANETVVPFLNKVAGTAFKADSKATQRLIAARVREGYKWPDFQMVIIGRWQAWKDDPKMSEYIRPSTLFGTKFEGYLQSAKAEQNTPTQARNGMTSPKLVFSNPIL